jgi:hypothetical protein
MIGPHPAHPFDAKSLEPYRPAWINVPALFPDNIESGRVIVDGLDLTREVQGTVHYWLRGGRGLWIAVASFSIPFLDGRDRPFRAERQLVPATAIRRRDAS